MTIVENMTHRIFFITLSEICGVRKQLIQNLSKMEVKLHILTN